ncbi:MAG: PAS domain S-box protein [Sedimentisphaerales bacterium]|jgi:PAS domain S-box-containing protein
MQKKIRVTPKKKKIMPAGHKITFFPIVGVGASAGEALKGNLAKAGELLGDIAERRKLEETHSRLAAIVEFADDAIIGEELDGTIISWNKGAEIAYGYNAKDIVGKSISLLMPPSHLDEYKEVLTKIACGETIKHYETQRRRKDGQIIDVSLTISPIKNPSGKIIGASTIARDITERKEMEAGLEKTRKELVVIKKSADEASEFAENVINTVREPLIALDQDLRVVKVSRSFYEFFKVKPEETVGQLIYDLGNKQWNIPRLRELLETILPQKSTFDNYEVEHDFTTIGKRIMRLNARQIQRAPGKERIILLAIDDITEHKKAQQAIEDAREYAENIVETIQEPLIVLGNDLKVISANSAFYQTFKVNHKETEGRFIYDLGNRQWNIPELRHFLEEVLPKNSAFNNYEIDHDFETIGPKTMLFNARRLDSVQMILITIYDITERVRAEEKLQKNEEQFLERKKVEIELKEANEQLIKFNDLKDEFVSIASHELRTPLSIISGAVKLLIDEIPGKIVSGQKEILDMAMRNLNRLARIVDALLNISKIESGKTELYRIDADICRLIAETVNEYSQQAGKKHINLSCQLPAHPVILYADADRIKEVISNLLSNSLKFTPQGGSIDVGCEDRNDEVFIFVKDTGRGVAKNDIPRMFEKFTQFDRKMGPGEKGTGLGLAICKGLVNLHNGKIWAESDTGSGMKISFTIPHLSAEDIFTESADNAVKSSLKAGGEAAVILISTKPIIQMDPTQIQTILKDISVVLEQNLRQNTDNIIIQGTKEVLVVLENCDTNEAAAVCQRLTQAIECHLTDKNLSSKLDLLTGYAAYPDDGQTGRSLIEKAREAGVAYLSSNKA